MQTLAEGHVPLGHRPVQPERVGVGELRGVTVGRAPQQQEPRVAGQRSPGERGVDHDVAVVRAERRLEAQRLLDERPEQRRVLTQPALQAGVGGQDVHRRPEQRSGGLTAGAEQRDQDHLCGEPLQLPGLACGGQHADQVVARFIVRRGQPLHDVAVELAESGHRGVDLFLRQQTVEELGAGVAPAGQLVGVVIGNPDQPRDDHHRQPVRNGVHPLDGCTR